MSSLLRLGAIFLALVAGVALSLMVLFAQPTLYGLRPHAVDEDLEPRRIGDLLAHAQNGPVTGILSYDAWYAGRDGRTGWFLLPVEGAEAVGFGVNGDLDPQLARIFGAKPKRCAGTPLPEKMIRAIEPARTAAGFLGRSTCKRHRMDLSGVIAASHPAVRQKLRLTHAQMTAFDAANDPLVLRDADDVWPSPYAYHRTIVLPLVWQAVGPELSNALSEFEREVQQMIAPLMREGEIGLKLQTQHWSPRRFADLTPDLVPLRREGGTVLLGGIEFRRLSVVVLCAPELQRACDLIDLQPLSARARAFRPQATLAKALARQRPLPQNAGALRDVLAERQLARDTIAAPTSRARRFSVTIYDASKP